MRFILIILLYFFNSFSSFGESKVQNHHYHSTHPISILHQDDFNFGDLYFDNSDDDLLDTQKKLQQLFYVPLFKSSIAFFRYNTPAHFTSHSKDHSQLLLCKICVLRI